MSFEKTIKENLKTNKELNLNRVADHMIFTVDTVVPELGEMRYKMSKRRREIDVLCLRKMSVSYQDDPENKAIRKDTLQFARILDSFISNLDFYLEEFHDFTDQMEKKRDEKMLEISRKQAEKLIGES